MWMTRLAPPSQDEATRLLPRPKPLVERLDIDQTAGMAAFADAAFVVEGFDLEADHPALDRDHPRGGAHRRADRRRGEMADVDLGADRDPARLADKALVASADAISISRIIIGVA